jgi:signal transduction histidine kinase
MSAPAPAGERSGVGVSALELFVEVLARAGDGSASVDHFYDRLCEAICRLAHMRRAIIFRYDPARRRVGAVGAHGLELERFAEAHVSVESAPITARALRDDRALEVVGDLRDQIAPDFAALFEQPVRLVCAPMVAADRQIGVILADRFLSDPPTTDEERDLLWTLGKAAALASVAGIVATQAENARQLEHRIDLAREIHEGVIQRLFGVSMALDGGGDLPATARSRCAHEVQAALSDLRAALKRPLGRTPRQTQTTLREEVGRLARAYPELGISLEMDSGKQVPAKLEPLAQSVLSEAILNARKHARPSRVSVSAGRTDDAFVLDVVNDGVTRGQRHHPGIGLRLAALEALQSGGVLEFGKQGPGTWQVRLVVPCDE